MALLDCLVWLDSHVDWSACSCAVTVVKSGAPAEVDAELQAFGALENFLGHIATGESE